MHTFISVDEHISLYPLKMADAKEIFTLISQNRAYLGKWLPFIALTREQKDTTCFIEAMIHARNEEMEFVFTMLYKGGIVGLIGLRIVDKINRKSEIGYWIAESFQKKGIVSKSVRGILGFAFNERGMNRVQIKCAVQNEPSRRIPQRLGFLFEGIEREGELLLNGEFTDLEVYSLLKKEF
jgi:ribosomal-protein-serine acetyltransferase